MAIYPYNLVCDSFGAHPESVGSAHVPGPRHEVLADVCHQLRRAQRLAAEALRGLVLPRVQVHEQELVLPVRLRCGVLHQ